MKDTDFAGMSTFVRVQEKKLLDSAALERIADTSSTQDAFRLIGQNGGYDFGALQRPEDYEEVVGAQLKETYKTARSLSRNHPEAVEILACKYDYHNIRVALKAHYQGLRDDLPFVAVTETSPEEILKLVEKPGGKTSLPEHLATAVREGRDAFEKEKNPQAIDIALDQLQYAHMLKTAESLGSSFVTDYVRSAIDCYNLKTTVRVKNMQKGAAFLGECLAPGGTTDPDFFLAVYGKATGALGLSFTFKNYGKAVKAGMEHYEKTGNYSSLERLLDNYLIESVKGAKRISFGPEILFAYLVSKENEIRQVRIVIACKQNQIPAEILKERLRDNYV